MHDGIGHMVHPPGQRPPRQRPPPPHRTETPWAETPLGQRPPPGQRPLPGQRPPPHTHTMVNERAVRTLLECILVLALPILLARDVFNFQNTKGSSEQKSLVPVFKPVWGLHLFIKYEERTISIRYQGTAHST